MSDARKETVRRQFGAAAAGYVNSQVHARGGDLALLPQIAGLTGREAVLDVATATGHTAFALAPHAARVVGVDLTHEMLLHARKANTHPTVTFMEGDAEALPFSNGAFDVVTCRIAAHHFPEPARFCAEAFRVLRPGGRLVVIDNVVPEDAALDRFINEIDKLRDPSHVRAYRLSEWERLISGAGFGYELAHQFGTPIDREEWLARMHVAPAVADEVRRRFATAGPEAVAAFAITATAFTYPKAILVGRK